MDNPEGYLHRVAMNQFRSRYRRAAVGLRRAVAIGPPRDVFAEVDDRDSRCRGSARCPLASARRWCSPRRSAIRARRRGGCSASRQRRYGPSRIRRARPSQRWRNRWMTPGASSSAASPAWDPSPTHWSRSTAGATASGLGSGSRPGRRPRDRDRASRSSARRSSGPPRRHRRGQEGTPDPSRRRGAPGRGRLRDPGRHGPGDWTSAHPARLPIVHISMASESSPSRPKEVGSHRNGRAAAVHVRRGREWALGGRR